MAEQDFLHESEIARFDAETKKLEAEAEEIKKRVGQKWFQNRNAVLLIVQTLIAGIIGAGAFTFALIEFYLPFYKQEVIFAEQRVEIAEQGVEIAKKENELQRVIQKKQAAELNDLETEQQKQKGKLETQETALKEQEAKLEKQEAELKEQRAQFEKQEAELKKQENENDILRAAVEARETQLARQKAEAKKARKENETILAQLNAIRAKDSLKADKKTLSEKDVKSLERLERKTEELALKAVSPPPATLVEKLRSKSETLDSDAIFKMVFDKGFSLPGHKIFGSFRHNYEVKTLSKGKVIVDHATGLMWQQGGSTGTMTFEETEIYVDKINTLKFAGFDDWRLPTIEELISLVEPELQNWTLYLDGNFDETQRWIRSADKRDEHTRWGIVFYEGKLYLPTLSFPYYVRLVRSPKGP